MEQNGRKAVGFLHRDKGVFLGQDKDEAKTEAGQISIGILVFQDVWAIIVLAVQNHLDSPRVLAIAKTFTIMLAMVSTSAVFVTVYIHI